jgi:xanthine dehydrogenase accessory protein XdhC
VTLPRAALLDRASAGEPVIAVRIAEASGSTPREADAWMLVAADTVAGTIGGGRLEWEMIAAARQMLAAGRGSDRRTVPLGPEIGQCCGGRVAVALERADPARVAALRQAMAAEQAARPAVLVLGAGHVGRALANALAPLPLAVSLLDSRSEEFAGFACAGVRAAVCGSLAMEIAAAPAGAGFAVMTHSHALDSQLVAAVLERGDFRYLGLIGSATKRAVFVRALAGQGVPPGSLARLVCPVGGERLRDKRPEVIAALAAAEIATAMLSG